ncbi:MAG: FtsX-like permease family protein [Candidatus Azobacteroides sp.]|nr:FtsX-like permease family protein [Candidatus Azobacteroides sp.]
MKNIIRLAWKNIWRSKVRSGVIISAIAIGLFSGTFSLAFINGWILGTINSDIKTQYSHIQINNAAFLVNNDISAYFMRDSVEKKLSDFFRKDVVHNVSTHTAYRLNLSGMLASSHNALGVTAKGVFPNEEMQVTDVWKHIPDTMGVFLTDDSRNPIVISSRTAEKLRVRLHSRIVFTFQDVNGEMQSIAFRVGGIYRTTNAMFDEANVFVRYSDIFSYTGLPEEAVHEAAVLLPDIETCNVVAPQFKALFPDMTVRDWNEMNPALSMYFAYTDFMGVIILGIFLFALSFGIINTMLMAVLERTRELGMLGAIGMSKRNIFSMIMLETIFLTLVGGVVGIILGIAVVLPTIKTGIDLSFFMQDQFEDYGFASMIYPVLNMAMLMQIVGLVILAGILSAIYPARKALKLKPLDAIRD